MITAPNEELGAERLRRGSAGVQGLLLAGTVLFVAVALLPTRLGLESAALARSMLLLVAACLLAGAMATDTQWHLHDRGLVLRSFLGLRRRCYPWTALTHWAHGTVLGAEGDESYVWLRFGERGTISTSAQDSHFFQRLRRELAAHHAEREVEPGQLSRWARLQT